MMDFLNVKPVHKPVDQSLPGYKFDDVAGKDDWSTPYLIKNVLPSKSVVFMFSDSGSLKSFIALDMAHHVALGKPWHGHRVQQSGVMIIVGEGQGGFEKRIAALNKRHGHTNVPIWVVPQSVALDRDAGLLAAWIVKAEAELNCAIGLVVMDTFSLMMGGCDESSNGDVSLVLNNLRQVVEDRTVLLIHHTGHSDKTRERGAYQIRGNADVRIGIERDDGGHGKVITVKCLKTKDDRMFDPINLTFEVVELGQDTDGDIVTSLVMSGTDRSPVSSQTNTNKPLDFVKASIAATGSTQREVVRAHFQTIYPGLSADSKGKAFRRGWGDYMNLATSKEIW